MSENDITFFCVLLKVVSEDLVAFLAILTELFDAAEDPYFFAFAGPATPAPLN